MKPSVDRRARQVTNIIDDAVSHVSNLQSVLDELHDFHGSFEPSARGQAAIDAMLAVGHEAAMILTNLEDGIPTPIARRVLVRLELEGALLALRAASTDGKP